MPLLTALSPNTEVRNLADRLEQALLAGSVVGTWVWDVWQDVFHPDETFAVTFGIQLERCTTGMPLEQGVALLHPEDRERHRAIVEAALERGGSYRSEYRIRYPDGVYRWVESQGSVDLDDEGRPVRLPGLLIDIDTRRRAQEALINSNNLLRAFIDALPNAVFAKDREGRYLFITRSAAGLFGRTPMEIVGHTDEELFAVKAQATANVADDQRIMASGVAERFEERLHIKGVEMWWETTKAPLLGPSGEVVGVIASATEITERKRADFKAKSLLTQLDAHLREAFGLVQDIARESFRGARDKDLALADYERRLDVLSKTHDRLAESDWQAVELGELIGALAGDLHERLRFDGPFLPVPPDVAAGLAVAIGELLAASRSRGALSTPNGTIAIHWGRSEDRLHVSWREHARPRAVTDLGDFALLEKTMAKIPGGSAFVRMETGGLACDLTARA